MPRKIKEDIDLICIDALRSRPRAALRKIGIPVHHARDPVRHLALQRTDVIEIHFKMCAIVCGEELDHKVQYDMIRDIRREIADAELFAAPFGMRKLRQITEHRLIHEMRCIQLLISDPINIVQIHQIVAERRKARRVIRTRQFPRQFQMGKCRREVGKTVEDLSHQFVLLAAAFLGKEIRTHHFRKACKPLLQVPSCEFCLHACKSAFKGSPALLPTAPRLHDSIPPSHVYSAPDP